MSFLNQLFKPNIAKLEQKSDIQGLVKALQHPDADVGYDATCALLRLEAGSSLGEAGPAVVAWLVQALGDADGAVQRRAAAVLGWMGQPESVDPLLACLAQAKDELRLAVVDALGRLGDARAAGPLVALLESGEENVRRAAASALVSIGQPAVGALLLALESPAGAPRAAAAQALGRIGGPDVTGRLAALLLSDDETLRQTAFQMLLQVGAPAIKSLTETLAEARPGQRPLVADLLDQLGWRPGQDGLAAFYHIARSDWESCVQLGPTALEPLAAALQDEEDMSARLLAAYSLGQVGDARALEPLTAALQDPESDVRQAAAEALGRLGDGRALEALTAALEDAASGVRQAAVEALGRLGDGCALDPLAKALGDADDGLRETAARVLGGLGDSRAVEPLIAALRDPQGWVRRAAAEALDSLGWRAGQDTTAALYAIAMGDWTSCVQLGALALEPLAHVLDDEDPAVAQAGAQALGQIGDGRVLEPLVAALRRKDLTDSAGQALVAIGEQAVRPLALALRQADLGAAASRVLVQIGPLAVDELLRTLRDDNAGVRQAAVNALGQIGDSRALEALLEAARDEQPGVRCAAADALGILRDGRAVEALLSLLADPDAAVRQAAALALSALGDARVAQALQEALGDAESCVRLAAARALGQVGDGRAIEPLQAFEAAATSPAEHRAASQALYWLNRSDPVPARGKGRLLIVEDDLDQAKALEFYFTHNGYGAARLGRGRPVLDWCKQYLPDIVLLDIILPDLDGYQVCKQLRSTPLTSHAIIFFLTQRVSKADVITGLELAVDDYVTKPFDMDELHLRVRGAIRRAHDEGLIDPKTGLPGGRAVENQMRLLMNRMGWSLLHVDINQLDVFNHKYGQEPADGALRFTASLLGEVVDQLGDPQDFVGHISGNHFIIVTSTLKSIPISQEITRRFRAEIGLHYADGDRRAGRLLFEGRSHPFMGLAVEVMDAGGDVFAVMRNITRVTAELRRDQSR